MLNYYNLINLTNYFYRMENVAFQSVSCINKVKYNLKIIYIFNIYSI